MDIMHGSESLSQSVYVFAELHWCGGNGPAEYPSLTLILLPQASPTPTLVNISYLLLSPHTLIEGHLHTRTHTHIYLLKKLI